jgi:hypothetical protein
MKSAFVVVLVLAAALSASAQTPPGQTAPPPQAGPQTPPPQKVEPVKEADIRKLLDVSGSTKVGEDLIAGSIDQLKSSIVKSLGESEQTQKIVDSFLRRYKAKFTSEQLTALIIPIYDKYLSDEDVKSLIQFYESPLGQRTVKALPQIARESQLAGFDLSQRVVQQVVKEVQDEFPELKQKPPDKP